MHPQVWSDLLVHPFLGDLGDSLDAGNTSWQRGSCERKDEAAVRGSTQYTGQLVQLE